MYSNQPKWVLGAATGLLVLGLALAVLREYNQQLDGAKAAGSDAAQTQCAADTSAALLKAAQQALATQTQQLQAADLAVMELRKQQSASTATIKRLQGEITHVTSTWLPPGKTAPEPLPHCVFTNGFVRVYNDSISSATSQSSPNVSATVRAASAEGAAKTSTAASTTDSSLRASDIRQTDILQHITQYGSRCQDIETQLNQLLDYLEKQQSQGTGG